MDRPGIFGGLVELSDNLERPKPPRFSEEVKEDIGKLPCAVRHACVEIFVSRCFKGPIDNKGFAQDVVARDKSPVPAILAVVAIISHSKIMALRHVIWPEMLINTSWIYILSIVFL